MAAESIPADCEAVRKATTLPNGAPEATKPAATGNAPQEQSGVARPMRAPPSGPADVSNLARLRIGSCAHAQEERRGESAWDVSRVGSKAGGQRRRGLCGVVRVWRLARGLARGEHGVCGVVRV